MEGIGGVLVLLLTIGIGIASAIEKQKKAAHKPFSPTSAGSGGARSAGSTGRSQSVGPAAESTWREILSGIPESARGEGDAESYSPDNQAVSAEVYNAEKAGYDVGQAYNAETSPRRAILATPTVSAVSESDTSLLATENADSEQVAFDPTTDFDLRRAVIETEILTPKYF